MDTNETKTNEKPNVMKDNWLKVDELCPQCGQVTKRATGITKQSIKRLFSFNWKNPQEWIWTFVMIGIVFMAWSYQADMAAYNNFMSHQTEYCTQILGQSQYLGNGLEGNGLNVGLNGINNSTNINPWNI